MEIGPDHDKTFIVQLIVNGRPVTKGRGKSKKQAEQQAAEEMMERESMYFKKIEMHGFKSFAEPVTIDFSSGITCIVGPNGSGKSNISDAIRWVLGEQSPKMLRGRKMEEVIFSGTSSRKSLRNGRSDSGDRQCRRDAAH